MKQKGNLYIIIFIAVLLITSCHEIFAQTLHVTPHELLPEQKIVVEGKDAPLWKRVWDVARESALRGDFDKAVRSYQSLLAMKDNLQEARWELAKLMMYLKRWDEAAELLEFLLGADPENILYINSLGKVMLEMSRYERAEDLFKKVNEINPSDQTALAGLVEALTKLGKKNDALPYLEQLSRQEPTNRGIRRYLAFLYYEAGKYKKAKEHLTILARNEDVERDVLYKTAKTYEKLGLEEQAAFYWERMLSREPGNIEAHNYLAKYYEKKGQFDKSLHHLQAALEDHPKDSTSFARIGETYEKAGEYERALSYYEKYLKQNPEDLDIQRRVAKINIALVRKKQTLTSLDQPYALGSDEEKEKLQETINQYDTAGRYLDALTIYRKLLKHYPEDPEIISALVQDLLVISENEGISSIVLHLSEIASDNAAVYRAVAEVLEREEREEEMLLVLRKILELAPGDNITRQKLALIYLQKGELEQSQHYFSELPVFSCMDVGCLQARALLAEKLNLPEHGLHDYETLLHEQPDRSDMRLRAIHLAADLGLLDTAVYHAGYLQNTVSGREGLELKMLLADAYKNSGYYNKAVERYHHIIDDAEVQKKAATSYFRIRSWLSIAESYQEMGLYYEAEQALRTALTSEEERQPILTALFKLSLETGNLAQSQIWLQALYYEMDKTLLGNAMLPEIKRQKLLLQAEVFAVAGDYNQAFKQLEQALKLPVQLGEGENSFLTGVSDFNVRLKLAEYLMHSGDNEEAENSLLALKNDYGAKPEIFVMLFQVYRIFGQDDKLHELENDIRKFADEDAGRQLALAELFKIYNDPERQLVLAVKAVANLPDSMAAKIMLVDARIERAEYPAALEELQQFQGSYPENTWFLLRKFQVLVKTGKFQDALAAGDVILGEDPQRKDVLLLKARILWEMNRWKESTAVYESVVEPSVEDILKGRIPEGTVMIEPGQPKRSWWEVITFSEGKQVSLAYVVLSPQHAVDFSARSQAVNSSAVSEYALYRWQEKFRQELAVRLAVMHRDYNHATNLLENVLEKYGDDDFLLYDLAGLYSKLERLSDEGQIYSILAERNPSFPGLADAEYRNRLKRSPHTFLSYTRVLDDGWDGYKAVKKEAVSGGAWYFHSTNQKWGIDLSRIDYESTDSPDHSAWSFRPWVSFDSNISQSVSLSLGAGLESLGNNYGNTPLYSAQITGKLADELRAALSIKQDVTPDTIASLTRRIQRKDYKIELMLDLFPRLLLGGFYDFVDFSDSNWINNYTLWASYILIPEPTLLRISYNYDYYDAREGPKPGVPSDDGFALDDHPYWSPLNYWITKFNFYFKHQLSNDALARGIPSYYTIEYSLGYDAEDNDIQELKGSLNVELAKRYILSASYGFVDMNVYRHEEALISITYRW